MKLEITLMLAVSILHSSCSLSKDCETYSEAIYRAASLYNSEEIRHGSITNPDTRATSYESGKLCYYLSAIYNQPPTNNLYDNQSFREREEEIKMWETQAFYWATKCGQADIMRYLLNHHHPDIHIKDKWGRDLMATAVYMHDNVECLKVLYAAGLGVRGESSSLTPLYEAAHMARTKCMRFLLQHGAKVNDRCSATGETVLDGALFYVQEDYIYKESERTGCTPIVQVLGPETVAKMAYTVRKMGGKLSIELDPKNGMRYKPAIIASLDCGERVIKNTISMEL